MPDPTLYLFDGFNLLHAGAGADPRELRDRLASFVALRGARGVLVFDGSGADEQIGELAVRWAPDADALLERLAARHRASERVLLVSSDFAIRGTSGQEVATLSSREFAAELGSVAFGDADHARLGDRLDPETRERLERLRRGGAGEAVGENQRPRGDGVDVTLERAADGLLGVNLQSAAWEVNITAPAEELAQLRGIRDARWDEGRSIRAGESAGAAVFWTFRGPDVTVLIGVDDAAWDVAVTVPVAIVDEIVRSVAT